MSRVIEAKAIARNVYSSYRPWLLLQTCIGPILKPIMLLHTHTHTHTVSTLSRIGVSVMQPDSLNTPIFGLHTFHHPCWSGLSRMDVWTHPLEFYLGRCSLKITEADNRIHTKTICNLSDDHWTILAHMHTCNGTGTHTYADPWDLSWPIQSINLLNPSVH